MIFEILIVFVLAWLLREYLSQKTINLPGPSGLPIFGILFSMSNKFYLTLNDYVTTYGKVFSYRMMSTNIVSVGDAKLLKELYSLEHVTGRMDIKFFQLYENENLGVVNSEGHLWETHRRFTLRQLRDFGFGKSSMETMIMDEVCELVDNLKSKGEKPTGKVRELFNLAVVNSLWKIVSGTRFNHDDSKLQNLIEVLHSVLNADDAIIGFFFPWLCPIMPGVTGYTATRKAFEALKEFVSDAVTEHKKTFQPDTCRDFIDSFLKEMQAEKDPQSTFYGKVAEKQLTAIVSDLFQAGTETTSTTLTWAVMYMAMFPEVQNKLYKEIVSTTGGTRDVLLDDKQKLSYLLAVLDEVHRMATILPQGLQHAVTSDFDHNGVHYPKGTMIEMNAWYIHKNPETWGDPENFRPERFLTGERNTYRKNDNLVTFSVGRRACIGETLARDTLFAFLGNIVQNFEIVFDSNLPKPTLEPPPGFLLIPRDFQVVFKIRK